jgi:hypothetical protein
MRSYKEILKQVMDKAVEDNCQSWNVIAEIAMETAVREAKEKIIEELENMSNNYDYIDGICVIRKTDLDTYVYNLEYNL